MEMEIERDGVRVMVPGTWKPPTHRLLPEVLEQGRYAIDASLRPSTLQEIASALMPLFLTTKPASTEGMDPDQAFAFHQGKNAEAARLLVKADAPIDLVQEAVDRCALASKYYPEVAEIMDHIRPELEKRRRQADRIAILIAESNKPAEKPKPERFKPEPEDVRLRAAIERWRTHHDHPFMAEPLKRTAIASEKRLAEIEGREVKDWARDLDIAQVERQPSAVPVGGPSKMPSAGAVTKAVMRDTTAAMEQSAVKPWQAGAPVYQQPPEEPPPPAEIPEVDVEIEP